MTGSAHLTHIQSGEAVANEFLKVAPGKATCFIRSCAEPTERLANPTTLRGNAAL
jgi:hypothetical protein